MRLIWPMPYIAQWLEAHPFKDEKEAPVWLKLNGKLDALEYGAIRMQLKKIAARAGEKLEVARS